MCANIFFRSGVSGLTLFDGLRLYRISVVIVRVLSFGTHRAFIMAVYRCSVEEIMEGSISAARWNTLSSSR